LKIQILLNQKYIKKNILRSTSARDSRELIVKNVIEHKAKRQNINGGKNKTPRNDNKEANNGEPSYVSSSSTPREDNNKFFPVTPIRKISIPLQADFEEIDWNHMLATCNSSEMIFEFFPGIMTELVPTLLDHYENDVVEVCCWLVRRGWKISPRGKKWLKQNLTPRKMSFDDLERELLDDDD